MSKAALSVACFYLVFSSSIKTIGAIKCATSWGTKNDENNNNDNNNNQLEFQEIPSEWINDGYCDCPFDGQDETQTEACSGSINGGWSGIPIPTQDIEQREEESNKDSTILFPCPQQPGLNLPLSRVNDGICDCCDGADEIKSGISCPDYCQEYLEKERQAQEKILQKFIAGSELRTKETTAFAELYDKTMGVVENLRLDKEDLSNQAHDVNQEIEQFKLKYIQQRMTTMVDTVQGHTNWKSLLDPLSIPELEQFIIHSCQLAGEMTSSDNSNSNDNDGNMETCIPLRLSGIDAGFGWSKFQNFENPNTMSVHRDRLFELSELLYDNEANPYDPKQWALESNAAPSDQHRRRLLAVANAEDYYGEDYDYHDDYHYHHDDDDFDYDDDEDDYHYDHHRRHRNTHRNRKTNKKSSVKREFTGKQKEIIDEILSSLFSKPRSIFLSQSTELKTKISEMMAKAQEKEKAKNREGGNEVEEEKANAEENFEKEENDFDLGGLETIQSMIQARQDKIYQGLQSAAYAKLLLGVLSTETSMYGQELKQLALGTLYHGEIKGEHVWQILQSILPEFNQFEVAEQSCASPWAASCSDATPKTITRNGASYPPMLFVEVGEEFCKKQLDKAYSELSCGTDETDKETMTIPKELVDGYFGYSVVIPRREQVEAFTEWFDPLTSLQMDKETIERMETQQQDLEDRISKVEKSIKEKLKQVGGKSAKSMGPDGELYAIKDECFAVEAGKYIYELCIFGKAAQKERSRPKEGGTSLGRWKGMEIDETKDDGTRIMKWDQGAKCWNGPERSATAYVTCGSETKVLSANEPDTCRYVLTMESHIACDDAYQSYTGINLG